MKGEVKCYFCGNEIKEAEVPDRHEHKTPNPKICHHTCHMIHHNIYPENYNELRQLVEAKGNYQEMRKATWNQMLALNRLGFDNTEERKTISKMIKSEETKVVNAYSKIVKKMPVWTKWLENIHGIGPDAAGQIVGILGDISRFERISNLWSYCGYGLHNGDVQGLKKGQEHNYNHRFRSTLFAIAVNGFIMHKKDSKYGQLYEEFKRVDREKHPEKVDSGKKSKEGKVIYNYTDMHIHMRAIRKMMKVFLKDLWIVWRTLENLPVSDPYEVEFLNHDAHSIPFFNPEDNPAFTIPS